MSEGGLAHLRILGAKISSPLDRAEPLDVKLLVSADCTLRICLEGGVEWHLEMPVSTAAYIAGRLTMASGVGLAESRPESRPGYDVWVCEKHGVIDEVGLVAAPGVGLVDPRSDVMYCGRCFRTVESAPPARFVRVIEKDPHA